MDNINIYEIIGLQNDSVYRRLEQLHLDEGIKIGAYKIRLTDIFL